jgi:hypothetical protein
MREREFYSEVVAHVLGEALGRLDQENPCEARRIGERPPRASARHRRD